MECLHVVQKGEFNLSLALKHTPSDPTKFNTIVPIWNRHCAPEFWQSGTNTSFLIQWNGHPLLIFWINFTVSPWSRNGGPFSRSSFWCYLPGIYLQSQLYLPFYHLHQALVSMFQFNLNYLAKHSIYTASVTLRLLPNITCTHCLDNNFLSRLNVRELMQIMCLIELQSFLHWWKPSNWFHFNHSISRHQTCTVDEYCNPYQPEKIHQCSTLSESTTLQSHWIVEHDV